MTQDQKDRLYVFIIEEFDTIPMDEQLNEIEFIVLGKEKYIEQSNEHLEIKCQCPAAVIDRSKVGFFCLNCGKPIQMTF